MLREMGWKAKAGMRPGTSRIELTSSTKMLMISLTRLASFLNVTVLKICRRKSVWLSSTEKLDMFDILVASARLGMAASSSKIGGSATGLPYIGPETAR
jgi:hypothetical protein